MAVAGAVMKGGRQACWGGCWKMGVLFPESEFSPLDSSSVCLSSTGNSTELDEFPESSL